MDTVTVKCAPSKTVIVQRGGTDHDAETASNRAKVYISALSDYFSVIRLNLISSHLFRALRHLKNMDRNSGCTEQVCGKSTMSVFISSVLSNCSRSQTAK